MDLCWELASLVVGRLAGAATVVDEIHGFKYFDERDLLGFRRRDGEPDRDRPQRDAVTIGDEDPAFAGGSYVIVQKYLHDMAAWEALAVEEQERVIGRAKLSNVEMDDDVKPSNSHVALNTIVEPDGTQRQILRENMPFGSLGAGEFGTYFIGYAATPSVTELMLSTCSSAIRPGNYDRILDFSTAVTGSLFFVPTADFLDDPPPCAGRREGLACGRIGPRRRPERRGGRGRRVARHRWPRDRPRLTVGGPGPCYDEVGERSMRRCWPVTA